MEAVPRIRNEVLRLLLCNDSEGPACAAGALVNYCVDRTEAKVVGCRIPPVEFGVGLTKAEVVAGTGTTIGSADAFALLREGLGEARLALS